MKMIIKKYFYIILWTVLVLIFFSPIVKGKIPAPLDTVVGLYNPWRDVIWNGLVSGVPYKNYLITDPVRQQIPYRFLAAENLKKGYLSAWNPYSFAGTPLSANIQSGFYYPLNLLFLIFPFKIAWTLLIISAPLLAGLFIYYYLRFFKLNTLSCLFGSLIFAFSGFFIAWLEWGTITQVILWLPLILLSQEKLLQKINFKWLLVLLIAELSQLLAGHLQVSFYVVLFSTVYLVIRLLQYTKNSNPRVFITGFIKKSSPFILIFILTALMIFIQYHPLTKFISLSARVYDLPDWRSSSWFLPWKQTVQLIVPDFFGNPATLNYWGEWNYGEFISYVGLVPLFFILSGVLFRKDKKVIFYALTSLLTLLFITPNIIAKLPYLLNIPLLSTAQPTRLICLLDFSLAVLASLGLDWYLKNRKLSWGKKLISLFILSIIIGFLWLIVIFSKNLFGQEIANNLWLVTRRNLFIPTILVLLSFILLLVYEKIRNQIIIYLLVLIAILDLFRFGWKFTSFSQSTWFYPQTKVINYLQSQNKPFRFLALDRRIFPPNFSTMYKLEDVSGYDPLYLLNYAKLIEAWNSGKPEITPGKFNRIITPNNYESFITDLLNVRYILSLSDLNSPKLILRLQEGETRIYENKEAFPRVFFVEAARNVSDDQEEIELMYSLGQNLRLIATSKEKIELESQPIQKQEKAEIIEYNANNLIINCETSTERLLVLSEISYPSWRAYLDNQQVKLLTVDLVLRGVIIPKGKHTLELKYQEL